MISEAFRTALWQYRARGGRLYKLAIDHGMSPSMLSAALTGARRRVERDARLINIGIGLGLTPDECFSQEPEASTQPRDLNQ